MVNKLDSSPTSQTKRKKIVKPPIHQNSNDTETLTDDAEKKNEIIITPKSPLRGW